MYYQKIYLPFDGGGFLYPYNEEEQERDKQRLRNLYPEAAKRLQPYVEEACDRLEQTGGFIFDECPDLLQLRICCREVCKQAWQENDAEDIMMDICQILFYHEIYLRRCRHRENRRKRFF